MCDKPPSLRIGCSEVRRFELEKAKSCGTAVLTAEDAPSGAVFFSRCWIGRGFGQSCSGRSRRGADRIPPPLCDGGRGAVCADAAFGPAAVSSVSASGGAAGVCLHRCGAAALCDHGLWFVFVLFRLLLYRHLWRRRRAVGAGGLWTAVCHNAAVLFSAGDSRVGKRRDAGRHVLWEGTADHQRRVWTGLVAAFGRVFPGFAGRRVYGMFGFAVVSAAGTGPLSGLIQKREGEADMDDITRYGAYLTEEKRASQNTVSSYLRDVTQFAEFLETSQGCTLREADSDMVRNYMSWMQNMKNTLYRQWFLI